MIKAEFPAYLKKYKYFTILLLYIYLWKDTMHYNTHYEYLYNTLYINALNVTDLINEKL